MPTPEQIIFFRKNLADLSNSNATATASQGSAYANFVRNRNNKTAWVTTGSVDADNTTFTIEFGDTVTVSSILLVKHNFKAYTVKYKDPTSGLYTAFATPISETTNTAETTYYERAATECTGVQITITGTMTANDDKFLYQLILTEMIGQLAAWPIISGAVHTRLRKPNQMLSGKIALAQAVGAFGCELLVKNWRSDADLTIIEELFDANEGFLVWLCGGNESQFATQRQGYRLEDIYLMRCVNDYSPNWYKGIYNTNLKDVKLKLAEVTD